MSSSLPGSPQGNGNRISWQQQLEDHCRRAKLQPPIFNIVSDRRGGRTAWSSTVTVGGRNIAARYWYDGQYLNNAREDAAEVALMQLNAHDPGQLYAQHNGYGRTTGY
ncbi:hypothetical protein VTN77DRAFT_9335 [Rasamsonia byssochlamydoides]|uniref:uncharacterized protein n=1 Tax=Rasamsonia byssochlamydoides TaxID=89139 RepID=UPI003743AFA6